jgi:hypothetical protein
MKGLVIDRWIITLAPYAFQCEILERDPKKWISSPPSPGQAFRENRASNKQLEIEIVSDGSDLDLTMIGARAGQASRRCHQPRLPPLGLLAGGAAGSSASAVSPS